MAYSLVVAPSARRDLQDIVRYISVDSPVRARSFGEFLLEKIGVLACNPEMGRIVPELGLAEVRELIVRGYRIVYRLDAAAQRIEVVRVWHAARGVPELLC